MAGRSPQAAALQRLGLARDWDFLLHLPLRFEDQTRLTPVAALLGGVESQVEGVVEDSNRSVAGPAADSAAGGSARARPDRGQRWRRRSAALVAILRDAAGDRLLLRFVHGHPSQHRLLEPGRRLRVFGLARATPGGFEMVHPRLQPVSAGAPLPERLTPVYPSAAGVTQAWLRRRIERALREVPIIDPLGAAQRGAAGLPELGVALQLLHHPPRAAIDQSGQAAPLATLAAPGVNGPDALDARDAADAADAANAPDLAAMWRRIRFDELLAQQLALRLARERRRRAPAPPLLPAGDLVARLLAGLPFDLTAAQRRVWAEIEQDLARGQPMNRLLQGDVGSGKTVIAALAAARAVDSGHQVALMAPTEILAEQHFRRVAQWLAPLGVRCAWLAGRMPSAGKSAARAQLAAGTVQVGIGTHALIQDQVGFARLGLAIIDEQHRFGVAQRFALRSTAPPGGDAPAAGLEPHLLMLSATPIPRTLAMTYLADLDVSVIDQLPAGRRPVATKLVSIDRRDQVLAALRSEIETGRQAYWVCPLVDPSDEIEATAATALFEVLRAALAGAAIEIGLLHGQMAAADKSAVMAGFVAGRIQLLVVTTVIEVGVDVPNATLIVIEHAERFGLAQLHQLRGRVGRGSHPSHCILLFDEPLSAAARARLKVIRGSQDGFEIARRDLELRGPGEFLGARQSGHAPLRYADLQRDADLVELAVASAVALLRDDPQAARQHVERWLAQRVDYLAA